MNFTPPALLASRFTCPHCGAFASHSWKELEAAGEVWNSSQTYQLVADMDPEDKNPFNKDEFESVQWRASLCTGCGLHALWIGDRTVYPSTSLASSEVPEPSTDMPEDVRELYSEAGAVLPHSKRAAAALCRAALERLVKRLTPGLPPNATLDGRLVALTKDETSGTARALQVIRHIGNTALHGARDNDDSAVIYLEASGENQISSIFFAAINDLVGEHITRPRIQDEAYAKLPATVREDYERKVQRKESTQ